MAWFELSDLRAAGIAPPVPWRRVPHAISGMHGLGSLGRGMVVMQADPAEISAATQSYESLYSQIKSMAQQISTLVDAVQAAATGIPEPSVIGPADDASLIAQNAAQKLGTADKIYALDASWVQTAVDQQIHGGWAFGRDVVLGQSLGGSGNRSGRPLDPMNRLAILKAAVQELQAIQGSMAKDLGTLRGVRDVQAKALAAYKVAVAQQAAADAAVSQSSQFTQQLTTQAQNVEQQKAQAAQQLATQQAAFELDLQRQRQALELSRLKAEQDLQAAQANAQAQQLAQQAAQEQARAQQELALAQAKAQQELQFSAAQQNMQLQQAYAAQVPVQYQPAAAPYSPSMLPMTGAFPQAMQPTPWGQWNQAAAAAQAAGINPASVVSYGSSRNAVPTFSAQSVPMSPGIMPGVNTELNFGAGGGIYGLGSFMGAPVTPLPSQSAGLVSMLPGIIGAGGQAAANVLLARKGINPALADQQAMQSGGGAGLGASLGTVALVGGGLFLAYKLFAGGGKKRGRR